MTLTGFLLLTVAAVFTVFVGAKLLPSYLEYFGFAKALQSAADAGQDGDSLALARQRFLHSVDSQYVDSGVIRPDDLELDGDGSAPQLLLHYDKRIHMFYNIDALLHFEKRVPFRGTADSEAQ